MPDRYGHLEREVAKNRCRRILEIGVWDGVHSQAMIQAALRASEPSSIEYYGIDLFEDAYKASDTLDREVSKRPLRIDEVRARFRHLEGMGVRINLFKGDSKEVLPALASSTPAMDFVFVDGGHSFETVASDWRNVRRLVHGRSAVIFDDYVNREAVEGGGYGVNAVVDAIDRGEFDVSFLDPADRFRHPWGILMTRFVRVQMRQTPHGTAETGITRG
jgi:hypothetical protein